MLHIVSTPIGNLQDITLRALETLKSCDLILCEDTRHSGILLHHFGIKTPMRSFYKFNEKSREDEIISELHAGKTIALISDAGTPGISDPGTQLIQRCHLEKIPVTATPGACALIMALSLSSFNRTKFQFLGFAEKESLKQALSYDGLSILYEAPHRLIKTLQFIADHDPNRKIGIARELTKLHEELIEGTAPTLLSHFTTVKGECVILIDACPLDFTTLSEKEHVLWLQNEYDLSLSDAIRTAAQLRGIPKRSVYKATINLESTPND